MPVRAPITALVPTGNRADVIEDCLRSLRWADELLVVDSFSSDGTLEIAHRYADRVLQHEYGYSAKQKNWAIPQAAHEWVLLVDTDERVSPQLRQEIEALLAAGPDCAGYRIPRINYLLGQPLLHTGYYPDYQIRLFHRDRARYELRRVHAHILLDGPCGTLTSPLIHYAHRSLDQTIGNLLIRMTSWEAEQRLLNVGQAGHYPRRRLYLDLLLRPVVAFGLRYVWQRGWRDGARGLVTSLLWSIYIMLTYMKVWETQLALPEQWWAEDWQHYEKQPQQPAR